MEAIALNQEGVLQGYLDVLLAGAWEPMPEVVAAEPVRPSIERRAAKADDVACAAAPMSVTDEGAAGLKSPNAAAASSRYVHLQPMAVAGLKLALERPLVAAVAQVPEQLLHAQRAAGGPWLATLDWGGRPVKVLDTAALVLPADHPQRVAMLARCRYTQLIYLKDLPVALAVESADEEVVLPASEVRWRSERGAYPWLAATLPALGYALLDPAGFPPAGA